MSSLSSYILPSLIGFFLPFVAIVVGTFFMRKSGMLPAQARLDEILKDTIEAMQDRIETLEKDLSTSQATAQKTRDGIAELDAKHQESMKEKDASLAALQRALVAEQRAADQLRLKVDRTERKVDAMGDQHEART